MNSVNGYKKIPDVQSGYELSPVKGWFNVVIPQNDRNSYNYCENPSFENDTNGWTAVNSTLTRTTDEQYRGGYACKVTPSSVSDAGLYYTVPTGVDGTSAYSASIFLKGNIGDIYYIYAYSIVTGERVSVLKEFKGKGRWSRITTSFTSIAGIAGGIRIYVIRKSGRFTLPFYVDACQFEDRAYPTTYFDGDNEETIAGVNSYYWSSTPHASSSVRILGVASGGKEVNLNDYGVHIIGYAGLGMPPFNHISTPISTGGSYYQKSIPQNRQFVLACAIDAENIKNLHKVRANLISAFSPNTRTNIAQPMILKYYREDDCTDDVTDVIVIPCVYASGLEGNADNLFAERIALVFTQYTQEVYNEKDDVSVLTSELKQLTSSSTECSPLSVMELDVSNYKYMLYNDKIPKSGIKELSNAHDTTTTIKKDIYKGAYNQNNFNLFDKIMGWEDKPIPYDTCPSIFYAAGMVFDENGNAFAISSNQATIYMYNNSTSTWVDIGTVDAYSGYDDAWSLKYRDGYLYVGGVFTGIDSVVSNHIIKYNVATDTWVSMDTGVTMFSAIYHIQYMDFDNDGNLYVGCTGITNLGSTSIASKVSGKYNTSTGLWSAIGDITNGANPVVIGAVVNESGTNNIYFGGCFTDCDGVGVVSVVKYDADTDTWSALGSGLGDGVTEYVFGLLPLDSTHIYAAGTFTSSGATPLNYCSMFDSSNWISLIGGVSGGSPNSIIEEDDGNILFSGTFTKASSVDCFHLARWNGEYWSDPFLNIGIEVTLYTSYHGNQGFYMFNNKTYYAVYKNVGFFDGKNWNYLGIGANDYILGINYNPVDNCLYMWGGFTRVNGILCYGLAKWNGYEWSQVGNLTSLISQIYEMKFDSYGNMYIVGTFESINSDTTLSGIAKWNISTLSWESVGGGIDVSPANYGVFDLTIKLNGDIYIIGGFTQAKDTTALASIGYHNGSSWVALGAGITYSGAGIGVGAYLEFNIDESYLYVSGGDTIGGIRTHSAKWDGSTWSSLNSVTPHSTCRMKYFNGRLYFSSSTDGSADLYATGAGGALLYASYVSVYDENTETWEYPPVMRDVIETRSFYINGKIYNGLGHRLRYVSSNGVVDVEYPYTIKPIIRINETGLLRAVKNHTTGVEVYFNKTIGYGEYVTLSFDVNIFRDSNGNFFYPTAEGDQSIYLVNGENDIEIILLPNDVILSDDSNMICDTNNLMFDDTLYSNGRVYLKYDYVGASEWYLYFYADYTRTTTLDFTIGKNSGYAVAIPGTYKSSNPATLNSTIAMNAKGTSDDSTIELIVNMGGEGAWIYYKRIYQSIDEAIYG